MSELIKAKSEMTEEVEQVEHPQEKADTEEKRKAEEQTEISGDDTEKETEPSGDHEVASEKKTDAEENGEADEEDEEDQREGDEADLEVEEVDTDGEGGQSDEKTEPTGSTRETEVGPSRDQEVSSEEKTEAEENWEADEEHQREEEIDLEVKEVELTVEEEDCFDDFSIDDLIPIETRAVSRITGEPGVITIVNSKKNGKRISIDKKPVDKIGNPLTVQVALTPQGIAVAKKLPNTDEIFPLKKSGTKGTIYSGGLVEEITNKYNLDFSNRVSMTFQKVAYKNVDGYTIALFKLVP